jgi:hypothetical protein
VIWLLLLYFQLKHFVADYPLQVPYMLKKFLPGWDFILPLSAHCGVHAALTLIPVLMLKPSLWWLALADFAIHFVMDRIKASPKMLGRFKALTAKDFPTASAAMKRYNTFFWWSLGFDQMVHHLTHYLIIYTLIGTIA